MNNPINGDNEHDPFENDRARWEAERIERERLEAERLEAERLEAQKAEYEEGVFEESTEVDEEPAQLRLGDEEERLPWLESDEDYADDTVDTARIATVAVLGLLAVLAVVGLAWWLGRDQPDTELLAEGSTIEAPDAAFRARPENPGGQAVEGTGDVSFEVGEGQNRETRVAAAGEARPAATPTPRATASASARPSIDRNQGEAPAAAAATGGVGVQVGAYSSRASAQTGWTELTGRHSALSGMNNRIVQATVDGNTVYRLQAVSANAGAAEQLCRTIKSRGGDCRVMR